MRRCPKCGAGDRRPSHVRWYEWPLVWVGPARPFRCPRCTRRYWALAPDQGQPSRRRQGGKVEPSTRAEEKVLTAMAETGSVRPSLQAIAKQAALPEAEVRGQLVELAKIGFVQRSSDGPDGKERWRIRSGGQHYLQCYSAVKEPRATPPTPDRPVGAAQAVEVPAEADQGVAAALNQDRSPRPRRPHAG